MYNIIKSIFCVNVVTFAGFLFGVQYVEASQLPVNASASALPLDEYSSTYTKTNLLSCPGVAYTLLSGIKFNEDCAQYSIPFMRSVDFRVSGFNGSGSFVPEFSTIWTNENNSISVYGSFSGYEAITSATTSAQLNFTIGLNGEFVESITPLTVTIPFTARYVYNGSSVIVQINGNTVLSTPTDISVNSKTDIVGRGIVIDHLSGSLPDEIDTEAVTISCDALDVGCHFYNFRIWLTRLVMPSTASLDQINSIGALMDTKIPFAYFASVKNLDFSDANTATQTPSFTLPILNGATGSGMYQVHVSADTSISFLGDGLSELGNITRPVFSVGLWVIYISLIVMITLKMVK